MLKTLEEGGSFNALLALKILVKFHRKNFYFLRKVINNRINNADIRIEKTGNSIEEKYVLFKDNDFIFIYEVLRRANKYKYKYISLYDSIINDKCYGSV